MYRHKYMYMLLKRNARKHLLYQFRVLGIPQDSIQISKEVHAKTQDTPDPSYHLLFFLMVEFFQFLSGVLHSQHRKDSIMLLQLTKVLYELRKHNGFSPTFPFNHEDQSLDGSSNLSELNFCHSLVVTGR